ncbi:MAG: hypothetical protein ACT4N2_05940 [Hyphomicrobium sp.]
MTTPEEHLNLLNMLQNQQHLLDRGFTFSMEGAGLLVEKSGHARGLWRLWPGGFSWTPAGYNEPVHSVPDASAALLYTLSLL